MKNMRKRAYFNNNTKRRKKRPFHHKSLPSLPNEAAKAVTETLTSGEVTTKNVEASPVAHCTAEECAKWRSCWRDVKRPRECACDEVACRRGREGWKASALAGNESNKKMKG